MPLTINKIWMLLLGALGMHASPALAQATTEGVICSPQLTGESTRPGSEGCIDVLAWSWGASSSGDQGGGGPSLPNFQDFSFTKKVDTASEDFLRLLVTASPIKEASFSQYSDCASCESDDPILAISFRDVRTTSASTGAASAIPTENISIAYNQISYCYRPTTKGGSLGPAECFAYDLEQGVSITPF